MKKISFNFPTKEQMLRYMEEERPYAKYAKKAQHCRRDTEWRELQLALL